MGSSAREEMARRNLVEITDLHQPVLTEIQKQVKAQAEAAADQIVFRPEVVLAAARVQTGLAHFGPEISASGWPSGARRSMRPDRPADHRGGPAALRHHPPARPAVGRPALPITALVGSY